jgi:hypothetical protein
VKRYTRECVTQVLEEYPDLTGLGFTHGEGMGGMTPQQRQDWFGETILEGMRRAGRKTKLIHRVPLSANLGTGGSTSVETERITRTAMEAIEFPEGPIWAEIKFNWSHAFSSTRLIKVHGGKLSNTYFEPMPKNYKIAWMARNEDFFCLRWGVPAFVREHITANTGSYVGGYFVGSECYIPARDYFSAPRRGGALEVRLRAAVAVLQAVGPAALQPGHARPGVPRRVHAPLREGRRGVAGGPRPGRNHAVAAGLGLRLLLGFYALQRRVHGPAQGPHGLHFGGPPD